LAQRSSRAQQPRAAPLSRASRDVPQEDVRSRETQNTTKRGKRQDAPCRWPQRKQRSISESALRNLPIRTHLPPASPAQRRKECEQRVASACARARARYRDRGGLRSRVRGESTRRGMDIYETSQEEPHYRNNRVMSTKRTWERLSIPLASYAAPPYALLTPLTTDATSEEPSSTRFFRSHFAPSDTAPARSCDPTKRVPSIFAIAASWKRSSGDLKISPPRVA